MEYRAGRGTRMFERLLHQKRQAVKTFAHVGMAAGQPDPKAARDRDHRRRLARVSALISADTPSNGRPNREAGRHFGFNLKREFHVRALRSLSA
jgi:hypothetical protein